MNEMKYNIHILVFSLLTLIGAVPAGAQNPSGGDTRQQVTYQDVVYLRDGSVLRGTLIQWEYGQPLTLRMLGGQEITIPDADIEKVRQEVAGSYNGKRGHRFVLKERGLYYLFGLSFPVGTEVGISATFSMGYRFNQYLSIGGGIGYEDLEVNWSSQIIPVFLETRGYLTKKKIAPYYHLRAGLGFPLANLNYDIVATEPGIMLNPEVGVRFGGRDVHFYMGVGYRLQKATYTVEPFWWENRTDVDHLTYRRLDFKFGLDF